MDRIDKENYYLDIAETVLERSTGATAPSLSKMTRSSPPATTAPPEDGKTAWTWASAPGRP